ncbi:MAG: NfeD family protein [Lachnospiraceae bacterium]|nr:NfeD family protein [Lachnospiraceae bacterium]
MNEILCWLLLAAIFIIVEIITLGLTTIWFAGGAFIAALAGLCGANLAVQVILFVVVSVVLLALTRPIAVKYLDSKTEKTNAEALVGQSAYVLQMIDNVKESGQAKVNGMEWTARAKEDSMIIQEGTVVKIVAIQGVKLIVEKTGEEEQVPLAE